MELKLHLRHTVNCKYTDILNYAFVLVSQTLFEGAYITLILINQFFNYIRYKGIYCSQEVAIKVLKAEHVSSEMQKEFAQEVYIMRFVVLNLLIFTI